MVKPARTAWDWLGRPAATRAISLLMLLYLLGLGWLYRMQADIVSCQASYAEASATATQARTLAAAEDRAVLDNLITSIATARSREDTRAALAAYQSTRAETDRRRDEHPLPALPSTRC